MRRIMKFKGHNKVRRAFVTVRLTEAEGGEF
jgi:hypothetical protein